ncbi:sensor histidine kinase KdpD [Asticcacaulis sp. YBE204]|uniref:sensor histidine kinase n=1 Tax=Asticcacaulis sp. YBE204 TaxID=1282363 RepID=UPI0003C3ED08|nr:ATP-binding protein [Asticcacaulis sp. YBE204]ESQ79569.1 histidine kinase [Asticcacaulis sp. YBE204]
MNAFTGTDTAANGQEPDHIKESLYRQMLSAVSHDLKTPLATIIGSLEVYTLLEAKLSEEKRRSLINSALSEAYRLDKFITNILDMAKLESDSVRPREEPANLTPLIKDSITRLGPLKDKGDIRLHDLGGAEAFNTDTVLLSRVVGLVIENALKHTGKTPVVDIDYGATGDEAFVHVRDHGPGIPPDKIRSVFSKYTRLQRQDQQNAGTGLGLSIAELIMALLGGRIEVKNHLETGAVFSLYVPLKRAEVAA